MIFTPHVRPLQMLFSLFIFTVCSVTKRANQQKRRRGNFGNLRCKVTTEKTRNKRDINKKEERREIDSVCFSGHNTSLCKTTTHKIGCFFFHFCLSILSNDICTRLCFHITFNVVNCLSNTCTEISRIGSYDFFF